jgi:hypothetical protein
MGIWSLLDDHQLLGIGFVLDTCMAKYVLGALFSADVWNSMPVCDKAKKYP